MLPGGGLAQTGYYGAGVPGKYPVPPAWSGGGYLCTIPWRGSQMGFLCGVARGAPEQG